MAATSLSLSAGTASAIMHDSAGLSDSVLVEAAKSGDLGAWRELLQRHSQKLFRRIYRITNNRQDAEDGLQDALFRAFTHLDGFEARSSFSSWLTRIGINSALMILRTRRRPGVMIDDSPAGLPDGHPFEIPDPGGNPESRYQQRERNALLRAAIRRLPLKLRLVVELRYADERSVDEVARVLGISLSAAKSRLSRARSRLRESLPPMRR